MKYKIYFEWKDGSRNKGYIYDIRYDEANMHTNFAGSTDQWDIFSLKDARYAKIKSQLDPQRIKYRIEII